MTKRTPLRRFTRNPLRTTTRFCTRMIGNARRPNHLALALAAFSRAIRAHRRLAKLAPRLFDFAVVDREAAERRRADEERKIWEPLLNKVYGLPPDTPVEEPNQDWNSPVPKCRRTRLAMERELAAWELWLSIGRENMALFERRQPHALIGLNHLSRLLDVGFTFARLATGLETASPDPSPCESQGYLSAEKALNKLYPTSPTDDI
jgi:hypothetical protein